MYDVANASLMLIFFCHFPVQLIPILEEDWNLFFNKLQKRKTFLIMSFKPFPNFLQTSIHIDLLRLLKKVGNKVLSIYIDTI